MPQGMVPLTDQEVNEIQAVVYAARRKIARILARTVMAQMQERAEDALREFATNLMPEETK